GCRARAAAAAAAAGGPRAGLAARPGASAAPSAAAERGERLGGHHAALRLRPVHERALVSREAALRAAACGGDARDVQQSLPSVLGGLARLSAGAALVRLRAEEGAEPGSVPQLRQLLVLRGGGRRLRQPACDPCRGGGPQNVPPRARRAARGACA